TGIRIADEIPAVLTATVCCCNDNLTGIERTTESNRGIVVTAIPGSVTKARFQVIGRSKVFPGIIDTPVFEIFDQVKFVEEIVGRMVPSQGYSKIMPLIPAYVLFNIG